MQIINENYKQGKNNQKTKIFAFKIAKSKSVTLGPAENGNGSDPC